MTHSCIRIRTPLRTSVRLGRFPVSLDGLLWHALFLRTGDPDKARDQLGDLLSVDQGVFRASFMGFGTYKNERPLIATQTPTLGIMRPGTDLRSDQFHPTGLKGFYKNLQVLGGPMKNRLEHHRTYHAPEVYWDAVGDPEAICQLLNFYVLAVGLEANRGFGSVGTFQWEALAEDSSWLAEPGLLARVLPERLAKPLLQEDFRQSKPVMAQATPPYRSGATEACLMPPRIRRTTLNKIQLSEEIA